MAVVSNFSSSRLTVNGDLLDNTVVVSRNAAGVILVNSGAVATVGGTPTVANTSQIQVFGLGGNDTITLSEVNGALPQANLFGGLGNDVLTTGSGADQLFGEAGNDTLLGKGGDDLLFGGNDNDTLIGGDGDDQMFGQAGNDRMIWNPGDDSDFMEGGAGTDTAEVNAGNGGEHFTITANGARVRVDRVDPAPFSLDIGTTENLEINANGGNDIIEASGNLAPLIRLTIDAGAGDDRILAGNGADVLLAGDGNDFVDGQQGNDVAFLGAGDDVFQWDPGDGSDVIEGQDGFDRMDFNGANVNENFGISANGTRVRFTRDVANVTMELADVERIDVRALDGADRISITDLQGTDVREVRVDLAESVDAADAVQLIAAASGSSFSFADEGQELVVSGQGVDVRVANAGALDRVLAVGTSVSSDNFVVNGDSAAETLRVTASGTDVLVTGLEAAVAIRGNSADQIVVNGAAGNDTIEASGNLAIGPALVLDGGAGNDRILGSNGADILRGGDGNDFIDGQQGNDNAFLGAGNDVFQWDPGDGSDVIDGQSGFDTHRFNGAAANENFRLVANGDRVNLLRDLGNITMQQDNVERVELAALAGQDSIEIGDMSNTDVREVAVDLAGAGNPLAGDGAVDKVLVNGGLLADSVFVTTTGDEATISGLTAQTRLTNLDSADQVNVAGGAGGDFISATGANGGVAAFTLLGGAGNDVLAAGRGGMTLSGGAGNDILVGGSGNDTLIGGTGNDLMAGGIGDDTFAGDDDFTIADFRAGAGSVDRIDLRNVAGIDDFGDVLASTRAVTGGVMLDFGDDEITLLGVQASQLHADDFLI